MKKLETLGVMIDMSRNAVMSIDGMKRLVPLLHKMGYNCILLYTEDTYEVNDEPYFGYMRGRYSKEEMKELDALAASYGIEVIPCIQTLAHLSTINRWNKYEMDTLDILMADDERTYELVDRMFATLNECFSTRRLHVGMDEAHDLGRGKHLDRYGYETVDTIMKRHLARIVEIANKYNYELMIWSDMFFRPWNDGVYSIPKTTVPKEYVEALPKTVIPVYWDYYSKDEKNYTDMMENHKQLSKECWFAGGVWTWGGFLPHNQFTVDTMRPGLNAARKCGIKHAFMTMWGDNGAECSRFAALPGLFFVSQYAKGITDEEKIKAKFKSMFGISFDDFMLIDSPNDFAPGETNPKCPKNPVKYMLYNDYFVGHFDCTVAEGGREHFAECEQHLAEVAKKSRKYGYLFDNAAKLCAVLKNKYDIGVKTRKAYKEGNKEELLRLANEEYAEISKALTAFAKSFEKQWMLENKPYGFEVQDARLGGLMKRTDSCRRRLIDYVNGKVSSIPELDEEILTFVEDKKSIYNNLYKNNPTSNVM